MDTLDYNVILQDYLEEVSRLRTDFLKSYIKTYFSELKNRLDLRENTLTKYYENNGHEQPNPQELQQMGKVEKEFRTALTKCEENQNRLKQLKSQFDLRLKIMDQEALTWDPALKYLDPLSQEALNGDSSALKNHSSSGEKRKYSSSGLSPSISNTTRSRLNASGRVQKKGSRSTQVREGRTGSNSTQEKNKNGFGNLGTGEESEDDDKIYCFCRQPSFGEMIGCDGENCVFEWFHCECVGMTEPPQGQWYCPDCTQNHVEKKE